MNLRTRYMTEVLNRSWKQVVKGEVTVKSQITNEKEGFLNAVRNVDYDAYTVGNCDIFILSVENRNTKTGIKLLGDAAVWMEKVQAASLNATDIIAIEGSDYRIIKINLNDSVYGDRVKIELERM